MTTFETATDVAAAQQAAPHVPAINAGEILRRISEIKDLRDALAAQDSDLSREQQELQRKLIGFHEQTGLLRLADHGLSVSFNPAALRVRYEPEKWDGLLKWLVTNDYGYCVQRRLTESKVLELIENGVPLPEGITTESFIDIDVRRLPKRKTA